MNLKFLNTLKACYIACGEEFTAVLTLDGGVFTFGAGMYGQLGHNSTSHEYLPRKVPDLMGSEVTQIACGRCHILVYLSSNRFYSFGLGGNGQLGIGAANLNKLTPSPVKISLSNVKNLLPLNNSSNSVASSSSKSDLCLYSISAGGDQSFIITYPVSIF
jgi:E3 ubiquitin-protein ligase HERC4